MTLYEIGRTVRNAEPLPRTSDRKAFPQAMLVVVILKNCDRAFVSSVPFGDFLEKTKIEHSNQFRADSGRTMPARPKTYTRTVLSHRQGQR